MLKSLVKIVEAPLLKKSLINFFFALAGGLFLLAGLYPESYAQAASGMFHVTGSPMMAHALSPSQPILYNNPQVQVKASAGASIAQTGSSANGPSLSVILPANSKYPNVLITPASGTWDLRAYNAIMLSVNNASSSPITNFVICIKDSTVSAATSTGPGTYCGYPTTLPAQSTTNLILPLTGAFPSHGMDNIPIAGYQAINTVSGSLDLSQVASIEFFIRQTGAGSVSLQISPINFQNINITQLYQGIVDPYGQYTNETWPDKLTGTSDFQTDITSESDSLAASPANAASLDSYGGYALGPTLPTKGFFSTAQYGGKWWLLDPAGHLFFATGLDDVSSYGISAQTTITTGRENMFTWLPSSSDPLSQFYSTDGSLQTFDFYRANLMRKYGPNWQPDFITNTFKRLNSWGFNTMESATSDFVNQHKFPYEILLSISGNFQTYQAFSTLPVPDPFDPAWQSSVQAMVKGISPSTVSDQLLIGYFVDNEMRWGPNDSSPAQYNLITTVLQKTATSYAKQALTIALQKEYTQINALNSAWNTQIGSWDEFLNIPVSLPSTLTPKCLSDFSGLLKYYAETYYKLIQQALKTQDPNHLYLGSRFYGYGIPSEVVEAANEYADVVSFNIYQPTIDPTTWNSLMNLGKPVLISEHSFGAYDSGMFGGGPMPVATQQDRANGYAAYMNSALANPNIVGVNWFIYVDQPLTGSTYQENYNLGFVSVVDRPYTALVNSARLANSAVYQALQTQNSLLTHASLTSSVKLTQ